MSKRTAYAFVKVTFAHPLVLFSGGFYLLLQRRRGSRLRSRLAITLIIFFLLCQSALLVLFIVALHLLQLSFAVLAVKLFVRHAAYR